MARYGAKNPRTSGSVLLQERGRQKNLWQKNNGIACQFANFLQQSFLPILFFPAPFPDNQIRIAPTVSSPGCLYNSGMHNPNDNRDHYYYRVVIVRTDGRREVKAKNLHRPNAEHVARSLSRWERIVLERQDGIEPA
jgi:hypothetical protein